MSIADFIIRNGILNDYLGSGENVVIPDGVTLIGGAAFIRCLHLKSVTIPNSVQIIGDKAFFECKNLKSVTLGNGITTIRKSAFSHCLNLTELVIPESVTTIEWNAFSHTGLTSIVIPDNVKSIGNDAFSGCENLQSVTIGDGLETIGGRMFAQCGKLDDVKIGKHVKIISENAFPKKMDIRKYEIAPSSRDKNQIEMIIKALGFEPLVRSFLLNQAKINGVFKKILRNRMAGKKFRREFLSNLIDQNETELFVKYLSAVKNLPRKEIDNYIECSLKKNTSAMTAYLNEYRNQISLMNKLNEMDNRLNIHEKNLEYYQKIFSIQEEEGFYVITGYKRKSCRMVIPSQIQGVPIKIGEGAFKECLRLRIVTLEEGLIAIASGAFKYCVNLEKIFIPDGIKSIGNYAFYECEELDDVTIPDTVTHIGKYAFGSCKNLYDIKISKNIKNIEEGTFYNCRVLIQMEIPHGVKSIGERAFYNCRILDAIEVPDSVENIGQEAFANCHNLTELSIGDGIKTLYGNVIRNCKKLKNVVIGNGLKFLPPFMFYGCYDLLSVKIGDGLECIGRKAFGYCTALSNVELGKNLKNIGTYVFCDCYRIKNFRFPYTVENIAYDAFECSNLYDDWNCKWVTLQNVLLNYLGKDDRGVIPAGIKNINGHAFEGNTNLQSIVISDEVEIIGEKAFKGCIHLREITIGNRMKYVASNAFPQKMKIQKCTVAPKSMDKDQNSMILKAIGAKNLAFPFLKGTLETNEMIEEKVKACMITENFRKEFLPEWIKEQEAEVFERYLSFIKRMPVNEIDDYIEKSGNAIEIRTLLMEYKDRIYSLDFFHQQEDWDLEKELGLCEKTLSDYKKIFSIKKEDGVYTITKYKGFESTVIVPSKIQGIPVVKITKRAFWECEQIETVYIEDGVKEIGKEAFRGCKMLSSVTMSDSITDIGDCSFEDCSVFSLSGLMLCAPVGSYAEAYAKENKIKFEPL